MVWTLKDYPDSLKNLTKATKMKAIDIANTLLEQGYKDNQAIPIATKQAEEWYDKSSKSEREKYKENANITKSDSRYSSNPALLDANECVMYQDGKWSVAAKGAKRATKLFETKDEAVEYAKDIAKNKGSMLEVFRKDGTMEREHDYRQ